MGADGHGNGAWTAGAGGGSPALESQRAQPGPWQARPGDSQWLPDWKTAADELCQLSKAAAQIRDARIAQRDAGGEVHSDLTQLAGADFWEHVVANAAREAARVSAQLAYIGLDIGSIAVVRRKVDNNRHFRALELHFRDGDEVRTPSLVIAGYRDGTLHYGWLGRKPEAGRLDPSTDFSPQLRRLVLRLCELVALGYANDAGRSAPLEPATPSPLVARRA